MLWSNVTFIDGYYRFILPELPNLYRYNKYSIICFGCKENVLFSIYEFDETNNTVTICGKTISVICLMKQQLLQYLLFHISINDLDNLDNTYASSSHNHNSLYYTESEIDSMIKNLTRYVVPSADDAYGLADSITYIFRNNFSTYTTGYKNFKIVMNWYSSSTATSTGQCILEGAILNGRATGYSRARSGTDTYAFYVDVTEGGADTVLKKLDNTVQVSLYLTNYSNNLSQFYIAKAQFTSIKIESRDYPVAYSLNDDEGPFISISAGNTVTLYSSDVNVALTLNCPNEGYTHPRLTIYK